MAARERQQRLLVVLIVVLAGVIVYRVWARPSASPARTSNGRATATTGRRPGAPPAQAPEVQLQKLDEQRPAMGGAQRDLFRFKAKAAPPPSPPPARGGTPPAMQPLPPQGAAAPEPISLKFIGIVEAPEESKKIAVLSDGRNVYHGREGDIIEGRYRILHIGAESIEMSRLDGSGRQTIRLTGS